MYTSRLESITVPILFRIYFFEFFCVFSFSVNQTKGKRMPIAKFSLNLFISCSMPEKKQIKTRPTLKKESEDEFVLKNSFKANRCDRYFIEGKSFCKSGVLCSMLYEVNQQTKPHAPLILVFHSRFNITFKLGNFSVVRSLRAMLRKRIAGVVFLKNTLVILGFFFLRQIKSTSGNQT